MGGGGWETGGGGGLWGEIRCVYVYIYIVQLVMHVVTSIITDE